MARTIRLGKTNDHRPVDGYLKMMYRVNEPLDDGHEHTGNKCHVGWKIIEPDGTTMELCLAPDMVRDIADALIRSADAADAHTARLAGQPRRPE